MTSLLAMLESQAVERGLLPRGQQIELRETAALIRDMPYQRASDRTPETVVREWRGTCSGKHYALEQCCHELGIPAQLYHCLHRFSAASSAYLAPALLSLLPTGGLPDIHTFLRIYIDGRWTLIDVTWPAPLGTLGFPVIAEWDGVSDMHPAVRIEEEYVVRGAAQEYKEHLIATHCAGHEALRDRFIVRLAEWLAEVSGTP